MWTVALAAALLVAACGTDVADSPGRRTVPVLWAGRTTNGDAVGGIEPAEVEVRTDTEARFEVLLDSLEARGAGTTWLATSALAAALATLNAGVDPRLVDIDYEITGPIDGPSGGAILTIGTLASMRGDQLRPEVTMTGTIAPDGTIGMVGEIPTKIEAAATAGYRTVLVPAGAVAANPQPSGAADLIEYGSSLGVEVIEVGNLDEAYTAFTGATIAPSQGATAGAAPAVEQVIDASIDALVTTCREAFAALPADLDQNQRDLLTTQMDRLEAADEQGVDGATYGLGIDTLQSLRRAEARHTALADVTTRGLEPAWDALREQLDRLDADNSARMLTASDTTGLGAEQVLSLPFALGWFTYETGVLASLRDRLRGPADAALVGTVAATIAQSSTAIEVFGPDAVDVVRASPTGPVRDPAELADFMMGYVDFIDRAATAASDYVRLDTLSAGPTDAVSVLSAMRSAGPGDAADPDPLRTAVLGLAHAVTRFVLAETIVSGPSFGLGGFGIGDDPTLWERGDGLLALSVRSGVEQARRLGTANGDDASGLEYVLWQADLAEGIHETLRDSDRAGSGAVIALNELWYAVINAQMASASRNAVRFG